MRWRGRVHEQLYPVFETLGYERIFTDVQIEHVGFLDRVQTEKKVRRKLLLLRMDYAVDPNDPSTLLHLATALCATHATQEAKTHSIHLISGSDGSADYMRWAYEALTQIAITEGKVHQGLNYVTKGLARFPGSEQLLFLQASALYLLADYSAAAEILLGLIHSEPKRRIAFGSPTKMRDKLAPRLLGTVRRFQGAYSEAEVIFRDVLRQFPSDNTTRYELGLLSIDLRDPHGLKCAATQLMELPGGGANAGLLAALWHLRHGDLNIARRVINDLNAMNPQVPRPRMLRAEWLSKMDAPLDGQIQALRDILRIAPGNLETQRWLELAMQAKETTVQPAPNDSFPFAAPLAAAAVA
jgi:tetratricopeptide (TPR) repeat protein